MSHSPVLTDSLIRQALTPAAYVDAPNGLLAEVAAEVRRTPQRRPLLRWPWDSDLRAPFPSVPSRRLMWVLAVLGLLVALSASALIGGGYLQQAPAIPPIVEPSLPPTPTVGPTATPGLETLSKKDIASGEDQLMAPGVLDVYWPVAPGPWPVAVMFHGGVGNIDKSYLSPHAQKVAALGYVVFVPTHGFSGGAAYDALLPSEQEEASTAQAACAIAFAAQEAPKYGGDPTWITVFGHSAGASEAAMVTLRDPEPSAGCFADAKATANVLITWEGDWLMAGTPSFWDPIQAAEPEMFDAITPWAHIASRPDLKVILLESDNNRLGRDAKDALGPDGWLTRRDPDGAFTAAFQAMGAFSDDYLSMLEMETVLADRLEEAGNLVSFDIMPNSTHEILSSAGWDVFLDAFRRAAALGD